ncbi:hypothetical protein AVEN_226879-1 [Araneus ventricosus]|uniref:Pre-C2HC domain-containing protein n=1 Tax=Araneus ventricosus TaxID=182803 RepID=A0A4Y2WTM4_ARAVE|nr:hypothetical protein AVEN_226879-1 [Araneus ventricosus]
MLTAEQVEDCIHECGDDISLEDIHLYYIYLTRLEPSEKTNQPMIKLQSLAANNYGEDKIPGFYRIPILGPPPPSNTVHPPNTNKNSIPITFYLELTSPINQSTDVNMEQTQASSTNEIEIHSIADDSKKSAPNVFGYLKKTANHKLILQRIIDFKKISCRTKPSGEFLQLFCKTEKDHRDLTEYLDTHKLEYFVIPSQAEKLTKVVIRGMYIDTTCEEIHEELTKRNYRIQKVHQLKKFRTKAPMPLFQVQLLPSENLQNIYSETTLLYYIITVVKYERKTIGQCFHCQSFAHTASKCRMNVKCAICAESHDSRELAHKKNLENPKKKCANCGGPHTASYRGCPNYPKINNNAVKKGYSYAVATRSNNTQRILHPATHHTTSTANNQRNEFPNANSEKEDYSNVFRLLNYLKSIIQAIPNVKNLLNALDNESNTGNKFFLFAEALNK